MYSVTLMWYVRSLSIAAYQLVTSTSMSRQRGRQRHPSRRPRLNNANPSTPAGRSITNHHIHRTAPRRATSRLFLKKLERQNELHGQISPYETRIQVLEFPTCMRGVTRHPIHLLLWDLISTSVHRTITKTDIHVRRKRKIQSRAIMHLQEHRNSNTSNMKLNHKPKSGTKNAHDCSPAAQRMRMIVLKWSQSKSRDNHHP